MKKNIFVFILFAVVSFGTTSLKADPTWTPFNTYFPYSLFDVDFVSVDSGLAVGEQGSILRTIDGAEWWDIVHNVPGKWFTSVHFFSDDIAYAVGSYGLISRSIDGGATWTDVDVAFLPGYDPTYTHFRSVYARSSTEAYAIGYAGTFYVTTDGVNWTPRFDIPWTMHRITFSPNGINGLIAATDGRVYRSTNSGANWSFVDIQQVLGVYDYLNGVHFNNDNNALMVGNNSRIIRTTNAGASWTIITSPYPFPQGVHFRDLAGANIMTDPPNQVKLMAVGDFGRIIRSVDGGNTWEIITSPTTRHLYGVSLVREILGPAPPTGYPLYGYVVGEIGDGGSTGTAASFMMFDNGTVSISNNNTSVPDQFELNQNYPNPFNPETKINFSIPRASNVKLVVYDMMGREVAQLVNEYMNAGSFTYTFNGANLTSGTYFYRLTADGFSEVKKMLLIK